MRPKRFDNNSQLHWPLISKGRFFSEGAGKFFQFLKCHSCEPKIVSELLIPAITRYL